MGDILLLYSRSPLCHSRESGNPSSLSVITRLGLPGRGNLKRRGRIHPTRLSFSDIRKLFFQKKKDFE